MSIYNLDSSSSEFDRKKVCLQCVSHKKILSNFIGGASIDVGDFISMSERNKIDDNLKKLSNEALIDLVEEGIAVGKISLYVVLLKYKKSQDFFTDREWKEYRVELQHVLYTLNAAHKILEIEKPEAIFVYNSFYPLNRVFVLMAEKLGVKTYCLHAGWRLSNRFQTLSIGQGHHYDIFNKVLSCWFKDYKNFPALPSDIKHVRDHFFELIQGNNIFVYSRPSNMKLNVFNYYKIAEKQKVIVAVMSSVDERNGVETIGVLPKYEGLIFENQTVWLKTLIEYAKHNTNVFLIIRVHPREFPNRREEVLSEYAKSLSCLFSDLPSNVKLNCPADDISMYQLAKFIDVCLHAGSSVGKEMALLGIPVVNYIPSGLTYPFDLSLFADSQAAYFKCIEDALEKGWSIEYARKAFRWCGLECGTSLFDISDSCQLKENTVPSLFSRVFRKLLTKLDPYFFEKKDCWFSSTPKDAVMIQKLLETNAVSKLEIISKNKEAQNTETELAMIKKVHQEIIAALYSKDEHYNSRITLREKMAL